MGPGQAAGAAQGAPRRNCSCQARTGSLGPRAALQPPAPLAAEGTRCFLPGRPQPGSSPPSPPRAWSGRPVTWVRKEGRVPTARPPRRAGANPSGPTGGSGVACRVAHASGPLAVSSPLILPQTAVPAANTRGCCPPGDSLPGPSWLVPGKAQLGRGTRGREGRASVQQGCGMSPNF